jgi:predicted ester cyclase
MSAENKTVVRRYIEELLNGANITLVDEFFDSNCIMHHPITAEPFRGVAEIKGHMTRLFSGTPDLNIVLEDIITEGEKVVIRITISGTLKATGKHATWSGIAIYRVVEGKIVESWEELDLLGAWQRLGILPTPE